MADHDPTRTPLTDPLANIRALLAGPHPDARLLTVCDHFMLLHEESHRLYRKRPKGYMNVIRAMMPEKDALEAEIASTPARTQAGRIAKAQAGLGVVGNCGSIFQIARSALADFINNAGGA